MQRVKIHPLAWHPPRDMWAFGSAPMPDSRQFFRVCYVCFKENNKFLYRIFFYRKEYLMQKWDYFSIVVDHENIHDPGRPRYVNGHELPNWQQGENIFGVVNN